MEGRDINLNHSPQEMPRKKTVKIKSRGQNKAKTRRQSEPQELGKTRTEGDVSAADWASACFYGRTRWRGVVGSAGLKAPD